jgi:chromosome segregation ATPase
MIFALGFLAATLIALLIIPAINARADRLARRRAEALFPLSISELTAEKDHLRAEFAVMQRRIERKAEEALAMKHQAMDELGRRAVRVDQLETDVAERDAAIGGLQADLEETQSRLAATEEELAGTRAMLAAARETLSAVENAHRKTLDELAWTRSELERSTTLLAGTKAELAITQDRLEAREVEFADLDGRHTAALSELDAKRITVSDLETRLAMQTGRADDFERVWGDRRGELTDERKRLTDLANDLLAEQERGIALESRIRELEEERETRIAEFSALSTRLQSLSAPDDALRTTLEEGKNAAGRDLDEVRAHIAATETAGGQGEAAHASDLRALSGQVEGLQSEKALLEGALGTARQERNRLERELKRLRRTSGNTDEIKAENAELRRLITNLADSVVKAAGSEASNGPVRDSEGPIPEGRRKAAG